MIAQYNRHVVTASDPFRRLSSTVKMKTALNPIPAAARLPTTLCRCLFLNRPGFPKRVTQSPNPTHPQATFSPSATRPTRQTLVDLTASSSFGPASVSTQMAPTPDTNHHLASWHLNAISDGRRLEIIRAPHEPRRHGIAQRRDGFGRDGRGSRDVQEPQFHSVAGDDGLRRFRAGRQRHGIVLTDMPGDPMGPRQSESFGGVGGGEAGDRRGSNKSQNEIKGQFSARLGGQPVFGAE